ncbi:MAG: PD40 domain-containing protein [Gemmatimonadetes bacterium]|nr:PD40 domain-containing protein [Gemmatimonadota bacterium]
MGYQSASVAIGLIALIPGIAAAQAPAPAKPVEYYNPQWSPDRRTLLFESSRDGGKLTVFTVALDGSRLTKLTSSDYHNEQPNWSHDGRRIVFSSDRTGHLEIFLMNADGSNQTQLTQTPSGAYYGASFSPDDQWILYQGRGETPRLNDQVHSIRPDGSGYRRLTDTTLVSEGPNWSADGKRIFFTRYQPPKQYWRELTRDEMKAMNQSQEIVSMALDGSGFTRLTNNDVRDCCAALSSDGKSVRFVSARGGTEAAYLSERNGW